MSVILVDSRLHSELHAISFQDQKSEALRLQARAL